MTKEDSLTVLPSASVCFDPRVSAVLVFLPGRRRTAAVDAGLLHRQSLFRCLNRQEVEARLPSCSDPMRPLLLGVGS